MKMLTIILICILTLSNPRQDTELTKKDGLFWSYKFFKKLQNNSKFCITLQKEWKTVGWLPSSSGTASAHRKCDIIPLRWPTPKNPPTTRTSSSSISPPTYSGLILNQPPFLVLGRYTESGFLTMIPSSLPSMASFRASAQSWLENKMFVPKNLIFCKYNYNVHVGTCTKIFEGMLHWCWAGKFIKYMYITKAYFVF